MNAIRYGTSEFQIGQTAVTPAPVLLPNRIRKCSFVKMPFFPKKIAHTQIGCNMQKTKRIPVNSSIEGTFVVSD